MTTNEFPEVTTALENDTVLVNASSKSRKITFKNIFEAISFTNLATTAKNIIGAINELKSGHDTMNTKITDNTTGISELNTKINKRKYTSTYYAGTNGNTYVDLDVSSHGTLQTYPCVNADLATYVEGFYIVAIVRQSDTVLRIYFNKAYTGALIIDCSFNVQ